MTQDVQELEEDFKTRILNIQSALEEVKKLDGDRIEHVKERLQKALTDLKHIEKVESILIHSW